jgi:cytochrome P450
VRGHLIPKGWRVLVYFRAVHLDAAVHDDPHAFNPWRWKERADLVMSSSGFTPFGGGQRLCPGLDLARLEASIFLHHLVTSFRYKYRSLLFLSMRMHVCVNGRPILLAPKFCARVM